LQEVAGEEEVDLARSGDVAAGLQGERPGVVGGDEVARVAARLEEAYQESAAAAEKLATSAYPDDVETVTQVGVTCVECGWALP